LYPLTAEARNFGVNSLDAFLVAGALHFG
jgi:hypothetical protein